MVVAWLPEKELGERDIEDKKKKTIIGNGTDALETRRAAET